MGTAQALGRQGDGPFGLDQPLADNEIRMALLRVAQLSLTDTQAACGPADQCPGQRQFWWLHQGDGLLQAVQRVSKLVLAQLDAATALQVLGAVAGDQWQPKVDIALDGTR